MSSETTFWYKRREVIPGKDGGNVIIECEDSINLYDVLRGFWKDDNTFVLQMKDAHEESRYVDNIPPKVLDEMKKAGKLPSKERQWLLSYIDLHGIDIFRYRTATELIVPSKIDQLSQVKPPTILNPPKVEVTQTNVAPEGMKAVKDVVEEPAATLPKFDIIEPIDPPAYEAEETIELVD